MYILLLFLWSHHCQSSHSLTRLGKCAAISRGQKEAVQSPHRTRTRICSIQKYMHSHLVKQSHCSSDPHPHTSHSLSFFVQTQRIGEATQFSIYTQAGSWSGRDSVYHVTFSRKKWKSQPSKAWWACFSHSGFNSFHCQHLWLSACVLGEVCRITSSVQSESQ